MTGATKNDISTFLKELKYIITNGSGLFVIPRQINRNALIHLGLTSGIRRRIILGLTLKNYSSGPEKDRDQSGDVWIFGCKQGNVEIYIKLKIAKAGDEKIVKCISFHEAEYPLRYLYDI